MAKVQAQKKVKKKKWINIIAPQEFKGKIIGESFVADPSSLVGKKLSLNLMNLLDDPKKQNININFVVEKVQNDQALTSIVKYEISSANIKRLTRRSKTKIDDSFTLTDKDDTKIKIKPLILTRTNCHNSVSNSIRNKAKEFLSAYFLKQSYTQIINAILIEKLQKELKNNLKKIFPISVCLIRMLVKVNK